MPRSLPSRTASGPVLYTPAVRTVRLQPHRQVVRRLPRVRHASRRFVEQTTRIRVTRLRGPPSACQNTLVREPLGRESRLPLTLRSDVKGLVPTRRGNPFPRTTPAGEPAGTRIRSRPHGAGNPFPCAPSADSEVRAPIRRTRDGNPAGRGARTDSRTSVTSVFSHHHWVLLRAGCIHRFIARPASRAARRRERSRRRRPAGTRIPSRPHWTGNPFPSPLDREFLPV